MRLTFGLALALITFAIALAGIVERPVWAADGFTYSMMTQIDRGVSYEQAHQTTEAVYHMTRPPQWWHLFSIRIVYPWLSSLLWNTFSFRSLFIISALSYSVSAVLLYAILLALARPPLAALVALATMVTHEPFLLARSNLTDMTAFAALLWVVLAAVRYAQTGKRVDLALFAAASIVLSATRPVPYIPLCIGAAYFFSPRRERAAGMVAVSALLCIVVALILRAIHPEAVPFASYPASLMTTAAHAAGWFATSLVAPVALVILFTARRNATALASLGLFASTLPTVIVDPLPLDLERVVFFPAAIAFACGLAIALDSARRAIVLGVEMDMWKSRRRNAGRDDVEASRSVEVERERARRGGFG